MKYWQIAAGDGSRDYADVFLKFGVILVGPGNPGEYFSNIQIYGDKTHWAYQYYFPQFQNDLSIGDLIILKRPASKEWEIVAVGMVTSEYQYKEVFSDVHGWDLQHCREVEWKLPLQKTVVKGLRRGTFYPVYDNNAITEAQIIWQNSNPVKSAVIPAPAPAVKDEELIDILINKGLTVNNAEVMTRTIWKLRRLAKWYSTNGKDVSEHEIRTFLIIPLLLALGWSEQKIKIEWSNIDIAIFSSLYSSNLDPEIVIESKRLWDGLKYAPAQLVAYANKYPGCNKAIASDGIRYYLFVKKDGIWSNEVDSYMNLLSLQEKHPYDDSIGGSIQLFTNILPK